MTERPRGQAAAYLVARDDQPLIAIPMTEDGQAVTYYFTDEAAAAAVLSQQVIQAALDTAGAFSDLDWEETLAELDRIRHESKPTPPIDLDL